MSTPPQPPVTPGPPEPYTLSNLMPAPTPPPHGHPGYPPHGYAPPPAPTGPPRKPHWWRDAGTTTQVIVILAAVFAPLLIGVMIYTTIIDQTGRGDIKVTVTDCEYSSGSLPSAKISFTVQNTGSRSETVRLHWEYRDSSGARVDTDSSTVTVPAGDTVRDEESTLLNAPARGGTCKLTRIS